MKIHKKVEQAIGQIISVRWNPVNIIANSQSIDIESLHRKENTGENLNT
ncbi:MULTISPECIES: hypothetical protein [unclassified Peribacillus]